MTQDDENDFPMFGTVRDFMGNHTTETSSVPAIGAAVTELTALTAQLDAAATSQATPLEGIADDKDVVRTALEEAVFVVSEPLAALAVATNNNTLLMEVVISRSKLDVLGADELDAFATRVAARGLTYQTVLMGTYAITPTQVTAITTARTTFAPWVNKPRTARSERAGQAATIPGMIRQGKTLLRGRLDRLTNPAFFAAYRTARAVVNRHGAGGAGAVTIVVQWKGPGEADFGHDTPAVRPEQTLSNAAWAGAGVDFRTKSVDAASHAALSAVKTVAF